MTSSGLAHDLLRFVRDRHHFVGDGDDVARSGFEGAGFVRLGPERLNGIHQFLGLVQEGLAQTHRPSQICVHLGDQLGELGHGLDVFIPGLVVHHGNVIGVLHEARRLHNFQRINRRRQDDGNQIVRMQRNRHGQLLQFSRAEVAGAAGGAARYFPQVRKTLKRAGRMLLLARPGLRQVRPVSRRARWVLPVPQVL